MARYLVERYLPGMPKDDIRLNVRKDGGEIVFASNCADASAQGGQDVWAAMRESVDDPWSAPR